jgi:hypothetical protein
MQVEILADSLPVNLQKQINDWLEEQQWDENLEPFIEIIDIKYVTCYDHLEKDMIFSAMILYKSI